MLTDRDALAKTLAKSQKVTFLNQKNNFKYFFLLTTGDALSVLLSNSSNTLIFIYFLDSGCFLL